MADPEGIYSWYRLDSRITTSGQPTEAQLAEIRDLGVQHIVNLGLHTHEKALAPKMPKMPAIPEGQDAHWPRAAPTPITVPNIPWARLKRPVPLVTSAITTAVITPSTAPVITSSNWIAIRANELPITAKSTARIGRAANPTSSSGLRPSFSADHPTQGASRSTRSCGTMIKAAISGAAVRLPS